MTREYGSRTSVMEIAALRTESIAARRASIGALVRAARLRKRMSAGACARAMDVAYRTWVRWEQGKSSIPSELLPEIARLVGACPEDVIAGRDAGEARAA